ncbi:hypothetical protein [Streptacidiphilus anmyonensis]|uniref:hypothetical protein n=1 Tax=Streptacidiphilus anmyonensis TaxID=405782 RepID=UPI0005A9C0FF|nr:hypothetical protein [Streptacidiphilus anmyonensis]
MSEDQLPAPVQPSYSAIVQRGRHVPGRFEDVARSLHEADEAARFAGDPGGGSDVTVSPATLVVCVGSTQADALQAAADWACEAPQMQIHAIAFARMPGPAEEVFEFHVTLTVSSRHPLTGEFDGSTHHADRRM